MLFSEYEVLSSNTDNLKDSTTWFHVTCSALGLSGESGEVADIVKKHVAQGHELNKAKIAEELGDVLWYIASMARAIGVPLEDIANGNIEKLKKRYPDGFSTERSVNRTEE